MQSIKATGLSTDLVIEQVMMRSPEDEELLKVSVYSGSYMHKCAGIHGAMMMMTDVKIQPSEQHIELGRSRCSQDYSKFKHGLISLSHLIK